MKSTEKKRLVRDESELRVGLLIEYQGCCRCGATHRHLIVAAERRPPGDLIERADGTIAPTRSVIRVQIAPSMPCSQCVRRRYDIAIQRGGLFIIETGLEDEVNPYVTKSVEVRA